METPNGSATSVDVYILREAIKRRYMLYQSLDRDRFPALVLNTNRANYEPLRISFMQELYNGKGIDQSDPTIQIPSAHTLAQLFIDDSYVPSKKILNACRLYAAESPQRDTPFTLDSTHLNRYYKLTLTLSRVNSAHYFTLISLLSIIVALAFSYQLYTRKIPVEQNPRASGLIISRPTYHEIVPGEIVIEGKVTNADTVYVLTGSQPGGYWVQPPIIVVNGRWKGPISIGHFSNLDIGARYQIRAIVHPVKPVKTQDYFRPWPEAELSSEIVEVVKGNLINSLQKK